MNSSAVIRIGRSSIFRLVNALFLAVALGAWRLLHAQPVTIADPALEGVIRETLGLTGEPLTVVVLSQLTTLDASRRGIVTLDGLDAAHNLANLNLDFNALASATVPAGLTHLAQLSLRGNHLDQVSFSADLRALFELNLAENPLGNGDLGFLAPLSALANLNLEACDLPALVLPTGLTNLARLNLGSNRIANFAFLDSLSGLEDLYLDDNNLHAIPTALASLVNLDRLSLSVNRIRDFTPLRALTNLTWLDFSANLAGTPLLPDGLARLTSVNASENLLDAFAPPSDWTNLVSLHLYDNRLTDTAFLRGLPRLAHLDLAMNRLIQATLPPAATNLASLDLSANPLASLSFPDTLLAGPLGGTLEQLRQQGVVLHPYPADLRLTPPHAASGGTWEIGLTGPPGVYTVWSAPALTGTWIPEIDITNELDGVTFRLVPPTNAAAQFYRAQER